MTSFMFHMESDSPEALVLPTRPRAGRRVRCVDNVRAAPKQLVQDGQGGIVARSGRFIPKERSARLVDVFRAVFER